MAYYSEPSSGGGGPGAALNAAMQLFNTFRQGGGIDQQNADLAGKNLANTAQSNANALSAAALPGQTHAIQQADAVRDAMNKAADQSAGLFAPQTTPAANSDGSVATTQPFANNPVGDFVPGLGQLQVPQVQTQPPEYTPKSAPFSRDLLSAAPGSPEAAWKTRMNQYFDKVDPKDVPAHYDQLLTTMSGRLPAPLMSDMQRDSMGGGQNGRSSLVWTKNDDKGSPVFENQGDRLNPEEMANVARNPEGALASLPYWQRQSGVPFATQARADKIRARTDFAKSPPVASAFGTAENPGMLLIKQAMDTGTSAYTDPKTGVVDWDKLKNNNAAAFQQMFGYFKSLAPSQVIRSTELEQLQKSYGLDSTLPNFWDKIAHGAVVPPGTLDNMKKEVDSQAASAKENVFNQMDGVAGQYFNKDNPNASTVLPQELVDDPRLNAEYAQWKQKQTPADPNAKAAVASRGSSDAAAPPGYVWGSKNGVPGYVRVKNPALANTPAPLPPAVRTSFQEREAEVKKRRQQAGLPNFDAREIWNLRAPGSR